jgi:short-subunit dehydrogenase
MMKKSAFRNFVIRLTLLAGGLTLINRVVQRQTAVPINGSLAVVTGASQGIGAAVARQLSVEGARVVLLARNQTLLNKQVDEIRMAGGLARAYSVDLSDPEAVKTTAQRLLRENGVPMIVIHSAGTGRWLAIDETSAEEMRQMMAVPYFAAFDLTRELLPAMLAHGRGHFVIVNSPVAQFAWPGAAGYATTRWALRGFVQALRSDVSGSKIKVSQVTAGLTNSNYFDNNPGALARLPTIAQFIPTLTTQQVAQTILHAIQWNRPEVIVPWQLNLIILYGRLFPQQVETIARLTGWQRTASGKQ